VWALGDIRIGATVAASKFAGTIQSFLDEYLVSEEAPGMVPFGGRDSELDHLDRWLADEKAPPRLVLAAPAGRGKSALLVHWVQRLNEGSRIGNSGDDRWQVVFVPISMRFGTNRPEVFYEALAARLAEIVGHHLETPRTEPAAYFEDQCRILLGQIVAGSLRVLLIIDGIDEALGERFGANWFPRATRLHVRLLVSARLQVGDSDARGWMTRLGWTTGVRVQPFTLPPLFLQGVEDLLHRSGAPIELLAARPEITQRLLELSGGEPLLLRLYVEDLWRRGNEAGHLTPDALGSIKPGFGSYFRDWLERQHRAWAEEGVRISAEILDAHLAVLACAYGPLISDELAELVRRAHGVEPSLRMQGVLHPIRRFVIGTGQRTGTRDAGYILSHPKLGEYLREEYFDHDAMARTRHVFTDWGYEVVRQVNNNLIDPAAIPPYLLQYFTQHLSDVKAPTAAFMSLVDEGWLRAWEVFEGGYQGFADDVRRALRRVAHDDAGGGKTLGACVRCVLTLCSIRSSSAQIPPALLLRKHRTMRVSASVWRPRHNLRYRCG
jgi:hypothetical protein